MWGRCEWRPSGSLASYERVDRLRDIPVPVLLTCGRFDEATPDATGYLDDFCEINPWDMYPGVLLDIAVPLKDFDRD